MKPWNLPTICERRQSNSLPSPRIEEISPWQQGLFLCGNLMHVLIGDIRMDGIAWQILEPQSRRLEDGFSLEFSLGGQLAEREALRKISEILVQNEIKWLSRKGNKWILDAEGMQGLLSNLWEKIPWLRGRLLIEPEVGAPRQTSFLDRDRIGYETEVRFSIYREEAILQRQQRVFLSHKSDDKPLVRPYSDVLQALGFQPWIDEKAMPAGAELNRAILKGFHDSCAAVFFITPAFKDEKYLGAEINHAIDQKISKGDRFAIITLLIADENGQYGSVPDLLRPYVWKKPRSQFEGLIELLSALPLQLGAPQWKDGL